MTQQELLQSLNTEQGAALNTILEENFNLRGSAEHAKTLGQQLAEATAAKDEALSALQASKAQVIAGIETIHKIIADPKTDTERGITEFLHEATKPEREKQTD